MSWSAHTHYKDSGATWLGKVPEHWTVGKVKHGFTVTLGKMYQGEPSAPGDVLLPHLKAGSLTGKGIELSDPMLCWFSRSELRGLSLRKDDLLVAEGGSIGRCAILPEDLPEWGFQKSLNRVRVRDNDDIRFLSYLIQYATECGHVTVLCGRSTIQHLTADKLANLDWPHPCPIEQKAIADFLDAETAKIDALIAKQEQLIATLQKSRSTTVDLILDQYGFTMPRSLADLESATPPKGWRIIHLGTVLRQLTNGFVGPTRDILVDDGVPYIQSTHIKQGRIDFNRRPFYVRQEWHDERPRIHLREGDVLIVQTGDIGKVAVVPPNFGEASCHALQIARVKPEILTGNYLGAFLSSWTGYHQLCSMATGALHPHLEAGIRAVSVVVPPLHIQSKIVRQASEQTAKIDELVAKSSEVINTLQEYRSALITDAVTGKIDVREAVA